MARGDGVDRTFVRNNNLTKAKIANTQRHNEREKESYRNPDIVPERTPMNIHFKMPDGPYEEMFQTMVEQRIISTRGLKDDAKTYGELIFDVNSAYFFNHGGYEFAKQFYADAYRAAVDIVGGEQYILSAVMHADERNRAMSEAMGQDVYHYHLHVVYVPVVEWKQILWSKRCRDESLRGTVKETVMQVSSSKKWKSLPATDETGQSILQKNGKPVLRKSYSVLQDDFFAAMRKAGYDDVERGERGSTEEHLTVTQFKAEREQERLTALEEMVAQKEQEVSAQDTKLAKIEKKQLAIQNIERIEAKPVPLSSRVMLEQEDYDLLVSAAKNYIVHKKKESKLQKLLDAANKLVTELKEKVASLTAELAQYKSVRKQVDAAGLEQENRRLRSKLSRYESVIERNHLWHLFSPRRREADTRAELR